MTVQGTLRLPGRIHFGYGSRAQLPELLALHGNKVLAVVDPFLLDTALFRVVIEEIKAAGLSLEICSDVQPELPVSSLDRTAAAARAFDPDVVLGVGGGSALDAAKLIAVLLSHGGPLGRFYGENAVPGPVIPIVAVPTTAGTGSEVTPVAVVSDPERELKIGVSSPFLIPAAAVVDPELTLGAPASVTAHSGIDALVHAVESYTAAALAPRWQRAVPVFTGRNAIADTFALQAVAKLGSALPAAVNDPTDRVAHEEVALASLLAGMSFGPTGTHLSHALQYPIGAATKTPHGLGTGLMLPYVLDACRADPAAAERIAAVGVALGSDAIDVHTRADDAITAILRINREIGIPASLDAIGITAGQLPQIAELALQSTRLIDISPIPVTPVLLTELLEHALAGDLDERSRA